jgi:hypothetical protein
VSTPEYSIVVPSRKRVHNMAVIRYLLPTAIICVDEREVDDYARRVPKQNLLLHPPMDGKPRIMNWLMDEPSLAETLIVIDDDFCRVLTTMGKVRSITNAQDILALLENAARNCRDLELTTFCFSRTANPAMLKSDVRPLRAVHPVTNVFGVMGAARRRKFDTAIVGRSDFDWTLETLLHDRLVYADTRFFFDCGRVFAGRGGMVGLVSPDAFKNSTQLIANKWGSSVSFKPPGFVKKKSVDSMSIRVSRTNPTAQK